MKAGFWRFFTILFITSCALMHLGKAVGATLTCGEFQIEVPDTWEKLSAPAPILLAFGATDSDAVLHITFSPFSPAPADLNDPRVRDFSRGMTKKASKLLLETETTVAGRPAGHLDFEADTSNGTRRFSIWNVLAETGIYTVMLVNVSDASIRQGIIDSAKLIESAGPPETPEDVKLRDKIYDLAITLIVALAGLAYFIKSRTHKAGYLQPEQLELNL